MRIKSASVNRTTRAEESDQLVSHHHTEEIVNEAHANGLGCPDIQIKEEPDVPEQNGRASDDADSDSGSVECISESRHSDSGQGNINIKDEFDSAPESEYDFDSADVKDEEMGVKEESDEEGASWRDAAEQGGEEKGNVSPKAGFPKTVVVQRE